MIRFASSAAVLPVLFALLYLPGCATKDELRGGRFLSNYGSLKQTPNSNGAWIWANTRKAQWDRYSRFTLTPLLIQFRPNTPVPVSMQYIDRAELAYRKAVTAALTRAGFSFAEAPGPGVLLVKGAVTDTYEATDIKNAQRAAMEIELADSRTNQRIFAMVDPHFAEQADGSYSRDPVVIFDRWADRLREQVELAKSQAK